MLHTFFFLNRHVLSSTTNTQYVFFCFPLPDKLAEGLVVGEGTVVFLSKDVVNVFHAPGLQQLGGAFGLTTRSSFENKKKKKRHVPLPN